MVCANTYSPSVRQSVSQSVSQLTNQQINQSTNQPIHLSTRSVDLNSERERAIGRTGALTNHRDCPARVILPVTRTHLVSKATVELSRQPRTVQNCLECWLAFSFSSVLCVSLSTFPRLCLFLLSRSGTFTLINTFMCQERPG